jgi:Cdc6-like AAA superfamily ATPase
MESAESGAKNPEELQEKRFYYPVSDTKQMVFDQLTTLPLHFKLVLYACLILLSQDKKELKVTKADVFLEYTKLASELNIEWISMGRVTEIIKVG